MLKQGRTQSTRDGRRQRWAGAQRKTKGERGRERGVSAPPAQVRCMVRDGDGWQDLVPFWKCLPATSHGFHHSTVEFAPSLPHVWAEGIAKAFLQHVQQGLADSLQTKQRGVKLSTEG